MTALYTYYLLLIEWFLLHQSCPSFAGICHLHLILYTSVSLFSTIIDSKYLSLRSVLVDVKICCSGAPFSTSYSLYRSTVDRTWFNPPFIDGICPAQYTPPRHNYLFPCSQPEPYCTTFFFYSAAGCVSLSPPGVFQFSM
jgi:hypothetical protein